MQVCNLSHTNHPACVVDECVQTEGRMLRACGYTRTRMHTAGLQSTHRGATSTTTITTTTILLGLEAARCSWEVLHQHSRRSGVLSSVPASWLCSAKQGSRVGAGSSPSLGCRGCGSKPPQTAVPLPPGSLCVAPRRQSSSFSLFSMLLPWRI